MTACAFTKYEGSADCRGDVWVDGLCHPHALVYEYMRQTRHAEMMKVVRVELKTESATSNGHAEPQSPPPQYEDGKRAERCIYFKKGKFEVMCRGKSLGRFPDLADAIAARDAYEADNPPMSLVEKTRRGGKKTQANRRAKAATAAPLPAPEPPEEPEPMEPQADAPPPFVEGKRVEPNITYRKGRFQVIVAAKTVGTFDTVPDARQARDDYLAAKARTNGATLQVGDVVTLKSGGEPMTVTGLCADGVDLMAWSKGRLRKACLPAECLKT